MVSWSRFTATRRRITSKPKPLRAARARIDRPRSRCAGGGMMDQLDVDRLAATISDILANADPEDRSARVHEYLESGGAAGDWPSIRDLIVNAKTPPTAEQIHATLKYVFCQPLTPAERANVIGANG